MDWILDRQKRPKTHAYLYTASLLLLLLTTGRSFAQKENNVWVFGYHMGLDFNSDSPVLFNTAIAQLEGSASVSDEEGNLLMYSDGYTVWNRNHVAMPNGEGLSFPGNTFSTSQACVLVRSFENKNTYYLFSLEHCGSQKLYYSVVDMTLDGGLGDVVPGQKMIPLSDSLSEKMSIASTACKAWLMVRAQNANEFKAFEINTTGLNTTPVVTTIGTQPLHAYGMGTLRFSHDNKQMVSVAHSFSVYGYSAVELYDFNFATGSLSNVRTLDLNYLPGVAANYYDASFSPDNSKLYATKLGKLVQFDMSLPTTADIIASKTILDIPGGQVLFGVEAGPDDKMYITDHPFTLHRIEQPNLAGTACQLTTPFLTVTVPMGVAGLPNRVVSTTKEKISTQQSLKSCMPITLSAIDEAPGYTWNTGASTPTITVATSGVYWVTYTNNCVLRTDSFNVTLLPLLQPQLGKDVELCAGDAPHTLNSLLPATYTVLWNTGSQEHSLPVTEAGTYWIKVTTPGCEATDSVTVTKQYCDCVVRMPNAFSPNADGLNDIFKPWLLHCFDINNYSLRIFNRWGQCIFSSYVPEKGWDGRLNGNVSDEGTYHFEMKYDSPQQGAGVQYTKGDFLLIR